MTGMRTTPPAAVSPSVETLAEKAQSWADLLRRGGTGWLLAVKDLPPILDDIAASLVAVAARAEQAEHRAQGWVQHDTEAYAAQSLRALQRAEAAEDRAERLEAAVIDAQRRFAMIEDEPATLTGDETREYLATVVGIMAGMAERGQDELTVALAAVPSEDSAPVFLASPTQSGASPEGNDRVTGAGNLSADRGDETT